MIYYSTVFYDANVHVIYIQKNSVKTEELTGYYPDMTDISPR